MRSMSALFNPSQNNGGKTRVAMALIDVLLRANRAQRVLFLADRKELRDQAYGDNGFKTFFPNESKVRACRHRDFADCLQFYYHCSRLGSEKRLF